MHRGTALPRSCHGDTETEENVTIPWRNIFWKFDLCVSRKQTVWDFGAYVRALCPNCAPLVKIASLDPSNNTYILGAQF